MRPICLMRPLAALALLAACNAGSGEPPLELTLPARITGEYHGFAASDAGAPTVLDYHGFENDGTPRAGSAGTLDHETGTISGGLLAGTLDAGRSTVTLDGGGTAAIGDPAGATYVRTFATDTGGTDVFGVLGQHTLVADMPSGGAIYTGTGDLSVQQDTALYDLTATSRITARFDSSRVDVELRNFTGTRNDGGTVVTGSFGGSVRLNGAALSGATFSGGTLSASVDSHSASGSASVTGSGGAFFGPAAEEVGGVVIVDDTAVGDMALQGRYIARR